MLMTQGHRLLTGMLAAGLLGLAGYGGYRGQARQAATLARITALDSCLTASNRQRAQAARATMASINYYVVRNRNRTSDLAVLHVAQQIQAATKGLTDTLHRLRQGWPATGTPAAMTQLSAQLSRYVGLMQPFMPEQPRQIQADTLQYLDTTRALVPILPALNQPSPQRALTGWFGEFDLRKTPAQAAIAALTQLETQVRQAAAEALDNQARKVGNGCDLCFDKIGAFAIPTSNTVAPGQQYEARLLLSSAASGIRVRIMANGRALIVDPAGQGLFTFRVAPAQLGQPDTVRAQWRGEIRYSPFGLDTVQRLTVPYLIVRRPQL